MDLYRKVDVLGQVTEQALKRYVGSLRSKQTGHLGSVSEKQESSSGGPSADEEQTRAVKQTSEESKVRSARVPRELEDF
eukprot:1572004-Amphidinium_carterae.1